MVLSLSWSCSRDCHKAGVHAEVSDTGAESRRERGNHRPSDLLASCIGYTIMNLLMEPRPIMALYGYTMSTMSKVTCSLRALDATPKERGSSILPTGKVPFPPKPYSGLSEGLSKLWLMPMRLKAWRKTISVWLPLSTKTLCRSQPATLQLITMASMWGALRRSTSRASKVNGTWDHFVCTTGPVTATWLMLR
jgi:hypothetical protein